MDLSKYSKEDIHHFAKCWLAFKHLAEETAHSDGVNGKMLQVLIRTIETAIEQGDFV